MALLKTIKDSFVNGWNKDKNEKEASTGAFQDKHLPPLNLSSHTYIPKGFNEEYSVFNDSRLNTSINKQDKRELINPNNLDSTSVKHRTIKHSTNISTAFSNVNKYENPFKLTKEVLSETNKYKFVFENAVNVLLENGVVEGNGDEKPKEGADVSAVVLELGAVPSLFNPLYSIQVIGAAQNNPLLNNPQLNGEQTVSSSIDKSTISFSLQSNTEDVTDCSIKKLVELSEPDKSDPHLFPKLGRSTYKYADFMYCKDLGKVANNHLITLRRFAYPIGDDIWTNFNKGNNGTDNKNISIPFDVGRLVCYLGDDNKLEDILKYKYSDSWRPLTSEIEQKDSTSENEDRGIIGSLVNLGNSSYRQYIGRGYGEGQNKVLNWVEGKVSLPVVGQVFQSRGQYSSGEGRLLLTNYDKHKVYEKQGTVQDTHIYEGKLQFAQEFTLIFDYELRAYENINPKSAFLDLLGNILSVTYKKGDFWGGEQKLIGTPENIKGWKIAEEMIDNAFDKVGSFTNSFLRGDVSSSDILGAFSNVYEAIKGKAGELGEMFGQAVSGNTQELTDKLTNLGNTIADLGEKYDVGGIMKGLLKNRLGRPSVYAFNSLLSGAPVGLWHVTIGNPRNPIMAMGNLILVESTIQHYGPLGIDDFPTGIKVAVTLKHAKSRDAVEIAKMYTKGASSIYLNFVNSNDFKDYFDLNKENVFGTNISNDVNFAIAQTKSG